MAQAITIKIKGLDKLQAAFRRSSGLVKLQLQKAISLSVALVNREAKKEAPVMTGRLRSGIRSKLSPLRGVIESTVKYGIFVHEGTTARTIKPVRKRALYWKGARHPVKSVRHPGNKANPFMRRGAKIAEGQVQMIFQKAINNVTKQLSL